MKHRIVFPALALIAATLTALGSGHVASPAAAVLAVFFWLRFLGHVRWPLGLAVFTVLHTAAWELAYHGTVPMPAVARLSMFMAFSLVFALVFLIHVRIVRQWYNVFASLALPCGWVFIEFVSANLSPTGSWGSVAYTFLRWPAVVQFASIFGWVGVTFFAVWIAALADLVVLRRGRKSAAVRAAALAIAFMLVVVVFGYLRIANSSQTDRRVRVLAVHGPTLHEVEGGELLRAHYLGWDIEDSKRAELPALASAYRAHLFNATAEAVGEAEIIVWSESLAWMSYDAESAWIERGQAFARENDVLLAMGIAVFDPTRERRYLNKLVLIDEQGEILWEFLKARLVPGAWNVVGDGILPAVDTRLGRIGGAICYDMDFPSLLRQAGRSNTELFLAPSFDDKKVRWMHARMAVMRAIEQGFTLIRPTAFGISLVADPYGRRLTEQDAFAGGGFTMHATVPVTNVNTIYTRVGDIFAWACVAVFLLSVILVSSSGIRLRLKMESGPASVSSD